MPTIARKRADRLLKIADFNEISAAVFLRARFGVGTREMRASLEIGTRD